MAVPSSSGSRFVCFLCPWGSSLPLLSFAVEFSPDTTGRSNPWLLQQSDCIGFPLIVPVAHLHANCCSAIDSLWFECECHQCRVLSWIFGPSSPASHQKNAGEQQWLVGKEGAFLVSSSISPGANTYLLCICWSVKPVTTCPKQG